MASSDDDLELAMALSMQQSPSGAPTDNAVVDLTTDNEGEEDERDDLKRAIALSLQEVANSSMSTISTGPIAPSKRPTSSTATQNAELTRQTASNVPSTTQASSMSGISGLDRKAMEAERLARLGKRKREPSPDRPSKQLATASVPAIAAQINATGSQSLLDSVLQYPRGTIKRTFATKFPRTDDITIDELLQASIVNIAVISSFQWDAEWLSRKLSHNKVKQIWVMNAKGADIQARWRQEMAECNIPNLKLHFPPMDGNIQSMHSKYMLLFSEKKLRIVVTTANMQKEYWGEVGNNWQPGVMENSVFVIDLPRKVDGVVGSREELTPFGKDLIHFLEAQRFDSKVVNGVLKFDFSQTRHLAFVHSIGGASDSSLSHPSGLPGLSNAIQDLGLDKVASLELDCVASSLGAINDTLLQRLHLAAQGLPFTSASAPAHIQRCIRIHFPTNETIMASIGGPDCAGIVSLAEQHYSSPTFPAACLRDYVSTRKGMISHNKLLFARGRHIDGKPFAWVYVGSANISESAWGGQKVLKSGKLGKLSIRNWECGVVMPVLKEKLEALDIGDGEVPPMSVFEGTIEVPFHCPGEPYNGRQPWFRSGLLQS